MKLIFKSCLGCFVFVILLAIVIFLFRNQIFNQVVNILGYNKPKDLGITYTEADLKNMDDTLGIEVQKITTEVPVQESLKFDGTKEVDSSFTNAEVTAQINRWSEYWQYTPFKNMQFRVNSDNTVEASGVLDITRLNGFISYFGYSSSDLDKGLEYIHAANAPELPIYLKGSASVENNNLTIDLTSVEVYNFGVPADITAKAETGLEAIGEQVINKVEGLDIKKLEAKDGQTYLSGIVPATTVSQAK